MNAGVIASIKARYLNTQTEKAVKRIDKDLKNVYKVDTLTVMRILNRIWEGQALDSIRYCCKYTEESSNSVEILAAKEKSPFDRDAEALQTHLVCASDSSQRHQIDLDYLLNAA